MSGILFYYISLQILPNNPCNNPHSNASFFIQLGHRKADIILFTGSAVIEAGVGHCVDAVGEADIDHALVHICYFAGVLALDAALF